MDLLASWNMDELPEQQTRMMHLMEQNPTDFDLRLGFDACCTCAAPLPESAIHGSESGGGKKKFNATSAAAPAPAPASTIISCPSCRRVSYCSEACRRQDAEALSLTKTEGEEDEEKALGHSSIVCALLQTCQDDEDLENGDDDHSDSNQQVPMMLEATRRQASLDRIRGEFQSYPATLANVLCDGPCYQRVLSSKATSSNSNKTLVIHVIGASEQAELWGDAPAIAMLDDDNDTDSNHSKGMAGVVDKDIMMQAYAQALAELVERFQFDLVHLVMIGPDCPGQNLELSCSIPCSSNTTRGSSKKDDNDDIVATGQVVVLKTFKGDYHEMIQSSCSTSNNGDVVSIPDIVVFFNPGFTVPGYDWRATLRAIPAGTPFLLCTNTELEGIADVQFLLDQDRVQSIPAGMADIFGLHYDDYNNGDDDEDASGSSSSFFSENPFCGTRVRQSGTMANDLFVKNRWMLGGIMDSFDSARRSSTTAMQVEAPKKRKTTTSNSNNNTKASNPALI
jgi:MYND finger